MPRLGAGLSVDPSELPSLRRPFVSGCSGSRPCENLTGENFVFWCVL
jgi:hypothetical protein